MGHKYYLRVHWNIRLFTSLKHILTLTRFIVKASKYNYISTPTIEQFIFKTRRENIKTQRHFSDVKQLSETDLSPQKMAIFMKGFELVFSLLQQWSRIVSMSWLTIQGLLRIRKNLIDYWGCCHWFETPSFCFLEGINYFIRRDCRAAIVFHEPIRQSFKCLGLRLCLMKEVPYVPLSRVSSAESCSWSFSLFLVLNLRAQDLFSRADTRMLGAFRAIAALASPMCPKPSTKSTAQSCGFPKVGSQLDSLP